MIAGRSSRRIATSTSEVSRTERIAFRDVDENREAINNAVWKTDGFENLMQLLDPGEELFHVSVVGCSRQHRVSRQFWHGSAPFGRGSENLLAH